MDTDPLVVESQTPLRQVIGRGLTRAEKPIYHPVIVTTDGSPTGVVKTHDLMLRGFEIMADMSNMAQLSTNQPDEPTSLD